MPLIDTGPHSLPYLRYEAPVDKKTLELREKFKVDPETGYPEHYKWRAMARLGNEYQPEDPFYKFGPYNKDRSITTKIFMACTVVATVCVTHAIRNWSISSHFLARSWQLPLYIAPTWYVFDYAHEKTLERAGRKAAVVVDYVTKHPERFGTIKREKFRELLFVFTPCR